MKSTDIKRLKDIEGENRRLKQMCAELGLDHKMLKDIVEKSCRAGYPSEIDGLCSARLQSELKTCILDSWHQR